MNCWFVDEVDIDHCTEFDDEYVFVYINPIKKIVEEDDDFSCLMTNLFLWIFLLLWDLVWDFRSNVLKLVLGGEC